MSVIVSHGPSNKSSGVIKIEQAEPNGILTTSLQIGGAPWISKVAVVVFTVSVFNLYSTL